MVVTIVVVVIIIVIIIKIRIVIIDNNKNDEQKLKIIFFKIVRFNSVMRSIERSKFYYTRATENARTRVFLSYRFLFSFLKKFTNDTITNVPVEYF